MKIEKTLKRGIYRHYKGNLYEVLSIARHSETEEWMIVYRTLYEETSTVWVRPYEMFTESVELKDKMVKRFEYMGKDKE
jgi:hypothetical protein